HLPAIDDLARLLGALYDAEPTLARAAFLGVDIALHMVGLIDDAIDRDHIIAGVANRLDPIAGEQLADLGVGRRVLDHQAKPAHIRALKPLIILGLVGRTIVGA